MDIKLVQVKNAVQRYVILLFRIQNQIRQSAIPVGHYFSRLRCQIYFILIYKMT